MSIRLKTALLRTTNIIVIARFLNTGPRKPGDNTRRIGFKKSWKIVYAQNNIFYAMNHFWKDFFRNDIQEKRICNKKNHENLYLQRLSSQANFEKSYISIKRLFLWLLHRPLLQHGISSELLNPLHGSQSVVALQGLLDDGPWSFSGSRAAS